MPSTPGGSRRAIWCCWRRSGPGSRWGRCCCGGVFEPSRLCVLCVHSAVNNQTAAIDHDRALNSLRSLKRLLDEAFRVPGTNIRFGWDPIIGLLPWVGDLMTALFSCAIIVQAHRMRLPRVVVVRMMLNVAIDVVIGVVPLVGDAADVFWK